MNIGILGGGGFVGSGITRALTGAGHACTVITRASYQEMRGRRFDAVINANGNSKKYLAAQSPKEDFEASVTSVQHSLLDFGYTLYIYCSSVDVYADHAHPSANGETAAINPSALSYYGLHKYLAEQLVRRYASRWLILRFGGFVGEGLRKNAIFDLLHDVPLRVHPDSRYQYLPTESAGTVIDTLLRKEIGNELFNVCGEGVISLREIADALPHIKLIVPPGAPPTETYDISIDKIRKHAEIPGTKDSVMEFIRSFRTAARPL